MREEIGRFQEQAEVLEVLDLGDDTFTLTLKSPSVAKAARAGTFVMVSVRPGREPVLDPLLPRPLSIMGARPAEGVVEILFRVVGRGTESLRLVRPSDTVNVIGPLGRPWPKREGPTVLVAGGIGMPPTLFLADEILRLKGQTERRVVLFYGARTASELKLEARFRSLGVEIHLATDDGTKGRAGTAVEALEEWIETEGPPFEASIFACGPRGMLSGVARVARERGIPAFLSFESVMACGVGVCRGCPIETRSRGLEMVCTEGPVFPAEEIAFDE